MSTHPTEVFPTVRLSHTSAYLQPDQLDWIDRTICVYLILPVFLFCLWFITPVAIVLLALTGFGTWHALRNHAPQASSIHSFAWLIFILALSFAWVALAGVGHFFYANADWLIRDAVLHDLSCAGWPPTYTDDSASSLILRAPVGYYLPAAAAGYLFGLKIANYALYAWTVLGWALTLIGACSLFKTRTQRITCLLVVSLFGGMDLLGYVWGERHLPSLGQHIEWWALFAQYSSNTTLLFWVPNHALSAWLPTILILRHWQSPKLAKMTPLLTAAIPLWSPLAAIGLFPFFLFGLSWKRDAKILFFARTSLPFAPIAAATILYLGMDAASVPHGWQISLSLPHMLAFTYRYALFCLLEFGMAALILARISRFEAPLYVSLSILALLPLYYYGGGNDLAMRASIPALLVLALAIVTPLTERPRTIWHSLLIITLLIGALGALQEPARAVITARWENTPMSIPESVKAWDSNSKTLYPSHYFAKQSSNIMNTIMRKSHSSCNEKKEK